MTTNESRADALTVPTISRETFYAIVRTALKWYRSDNPSRYLNDDQVDANDDEFVGKLADEHAKILAASPASQPAAAPIDVGVDCLEKLRALMVRLGLATNESLEGFGAALEDNLYRTIRAVGALVDAAAIPAPSPADERAARAEAEMRALADELTDRDPSKTNAEQGLFRKFDVRRVDGSDQPGGKHHGCEYFVLDMNHDGYARAALRAYARACAAEFPILAADLIKRYAPDGTPVLCYQCRGCGDNDAAPGHCVRCNGSGIEPHSVSHPDAAPIGSALSVSLAIVREIRRLADEHINTPKLSMELLGIANELARAASANETVPKWVFDNLVSTLQPAWDYIQTHQEQFNARAGDDKNAILVEFFLRAASANETGAEGARPRNRSAEWGGYLATNVERLIEAVNALHELEMREDDGEEVSEDDLQHARETLSEYMGAVRSSIYDFHRRTKQDSDEAACRSPAMAVEKLTNLPSYLPSHALRGLYKPADEYFIDGKPCTPEEYISWQAGIIEAVTKAKLPDPKYYGGSAEEGDQHDVKCAYADGWNDCRASILAAPQPAQADARVGLTGEQREAIQRAIDYADMSDRDSDAEALRALLQGANHAE